MLIIYVIVNTVSIFVRICTAFVNGKISLSASFYGYDIHIYMYMIYEWENHVMRTDGLFVEERNPRRHNKFGKRLMPFVEFLWKRPFNGESQWLLFSHKSSSNEGEHCSRNSLIENSWTPFSMLHCPRVSHGLTESRMSEQLILSGRETYKDKDISVDLCAGTSMFDSSFSWILGNFDDVLEWVFEYREYERLDRWLGWETAVEGWFGSETAADRWFGRVTAVGAWFGRDTGIGRCLGRDICGQMSVDDVGRPFLVVLFGAVCRVGHFIAWAVFDMLQQQKYCLIISEITQTHIWGPFY